MTNGLSLKRCTLVFLFLCGAPTLAMAYIDPGNGAYMVQALFTLVGAALFYLRHPIRTGKQLWHWMMHRGSTAAESQADSSARATSVVPGAAETGAVSEGLGDASTIAVSADQKI